MPDARKELLMPEIVHVTPARLLVDSLKLGKALYETGFRPKHAISIWRGGTAVGLGVDEYFRMRGLHINHTTIATESYVSIGRSEEVVLKGLEHVIESICREDGLLIIDDVYETGNTIRKIVDTLCERARANAPQRMMVGTIHRKPERVKYSEIETVSLYDVPGATWIDYPHELADLVTDDESDPLILGKSRSVWETVRSPAPAPETLHVEPPYLYVQPEKLTLDAMKLGLQVFADESFQPNFIVALWPGGIGAGLPLHEAYKYMMKKTGAQRPVPDHISLNTARTALTYKTHVVGLDYLADRINRSDKVLLVDSIFKSGRFVNDAIIRLKEVLRRNLDDKNVRVASVYWNPDDQSTWTVRPAIKRPHYYVKQMDGQVIYPHAFHRLNQPDRELPALNPEAAEILLGL